MVERLDLPAEVVLDQLLLRRVVASDLSALHEAVLASLASLTAWMPWAKDEPFTAEQRRELLEQWRIDWESGSAYSYGLFQGDLFIGACALHNRISPDGLEIGYWVRDGYTGRGFATVAARAMCDLAFGCGPIAHVEIHHDKANIASARVAEKLGFDKISEIPDVIDAPAKIGVACIWRMTSGRWKMLADARDR